MKEKDKRYRAKIQQYNVTFYLHQKEELEYFKTLGIPLQRYVMEKIREDMRKKQ